MFTALLYVCEVFATNPKFKPCDLYFATFVLDLVLINAMF